MGHQTIREGLPVLSEGLQSDIQMSLPGLMLQWTILEQFDPSKYRRGDRDHTSYCLGCVITPSKSSVRPYPVDFPA